MAGFVILRNVQALVLDEDMDAVFIREDVLHYLKISPRDTLSEKSDVLVYAKTFDQLLDYLGKMFEKRSHVSLEA